AADVRAEEVHHRPLPQGAQKGELHQLRYERQPEVEMEDVRLTGEARERPPLRQLAACEPAAARQVDVGLGMEAVAVEDNEAGVDAASPQRLHVRPRDAGGVDGAV